MADAPAQTENARQHRPADGGVSVISSIKEAEDYLSRFYEKVAETAGKNVTVERMWPLLERAGNPQEKLRVIHLAGTSGKTSTAYFTAALLKEAGSKVGLTISPHVSSITERLQIDGQPATEQRFCELLSNFIEVMGEDFDASYFEFLIVFVLWVFEREHVEYAVIETGLGGLHDGTNVFKQPDKICIITDIGLDHQAVLGNTISEIATQKAGIIHNGNNVFMIRQSDEVINVIESQVRQVSAHLRIVDDFVPQERDKLPAFQQRNWHLAKTAFDFVGQRDNLKQLSESQLQRSKVPVPGRMQIVQRENQTFILDGAHNIQKMAAFIESFRSAYPDTKVPILLSMKADKDVEQIVTMLAPITSYAICAGFESLQDMPIHSIDPQRVADLFSAKGIQAEAVHELSEAIESIRKLKEPVNIITGSFYILGDTLRLLA